MSDKEKLDSWKEIARHLKRDVRTCQRWEKELGLPVHRLEGTTRPRVFAYTGEIDTWIEQKHAYRFGKRGTAARLKFLGFSALAVFITALFLVFMPFTRPDFPADFKIEESKLVMLDAEGRELWEFDTGLSNLADEKLYRMHFPSKRLTLGDIANQPYILIEDLNADGSPEVLFSIQTRDEMREGILYCFSSRGKTLWSLDTGRKLVFGDTEYSSAYRIHGLRSGDWDNDGHKEVLCVTKHAYRFPCRVLLLDHLGEIRGDYCHSGYLVDYEFIDLENDGRKEIVMAGMNNGWQAACCAVLDPSAMKGASFQINPEYTCRSMERGTEKHYLLFPSSRVPPPNDMKPCIRHMEFSDKDRRLTLSTAMPPLIFDLNYDMELTALTLTHAFKDAYHLWSPSRQPRPSLKEIRRELLDEGILYLSGEKWSTKPSP